MTDFIRVTPDFAVAPQLAAEDIAAAAAAGFKLLVNNRPDGEQPGQMTGAEARAAAEAAGMTYREIPFSGPPSLGEVEATGQWLDEHAGPVLAFCRSGTRSITVWALAQARAGDLNPDEIIELAAKAGYDLSPHRMNLTRLSGG